MNTSTFHHIERRKARLVNAVLEDLIADCGPRTELGVILRAARADVLTLVEPDEHAIERAEAFAG